MKRLTREEVADVLKRGTRAHGILCTYLSLPRDSSGVSVVVSKKVARTAVLRNRIKRRMRAAAAMVALPKRAVVMIAKGTATKAHTKEFADDITKRLGSAV